MTFQELIDFYGTQDKAARALGITQPSVSEWGDRGIPIGRQYQIQVLTGGMLKADQGNQAQAQQ